MPIQYTVKSGDSLWKIAQAHGVAPGELLKANPQFSQGGRNPNLIYPGEKVTIPDPTTSNQVNVKNGAVTCTNPSPSVILNVEKNQLTLKHNKDCKLEIVISPASIVVDSYRIEIKTVSGTAWCTLSNNKLENTWQAKIAGTFKLRGVATVCGTEHFSTEKDLEVQFPNYAEITSDAAVVTATVNEWQNTLTDCTQTPNRRRERGFWVRLNTITDTYEFTTTVTGDWSGPGDGADIPLPSRPIDSPTSPSPCDSGATYSVASFHTHTPTVFRVAATPLGSTRGVGPSDADRHVDNLDDVPGVVYDYVESPGGSGSIPMGHPENSPAQRYHSMGRDRRSTPN